MTEPNGGVISPPQSGDTYSLFLGVAEAQVPVLPLTTSRCVSCGVRIASHRSGHDRASGPLFLSRHSSIIADPARVRVLRGPGSRGHGLFVGLW